MTTIPSPLHLQNRQAWITALLEGKTQKGPITQGRHNLFKMPFGDNPQACCLGVACLVLNLPFSSYSETSDEINPEIYFDISGTDDHEMVHHEDFAHHFGVSNEQASKITKILAFLNDGEAMLPHGVAYSISYRDVPPNKEILYPTWTYAKLAELATFLFWLADTSYDYINNEQPRLTLFAKAY